MLQTENLILVLAVAVAAYAWYRTDFRTPSALRLPAHVSRRIVIAAGWLLVVGIVLKSVGVLLWDGRVQIAQSGQMYAHRAREPLLFWGEIVGELALIGGAGIVLIVLGGRRRTQGRRGTRHS